MINQISVGWFRELVKALAHMDPPWGRTSGVISGPAVAFIGETRTGGGAESSVIVFAGPSGYIKAIDTLLKLGFTGSG